MDPKTLNVMTEYINLPGYEEHVRKHRTVSKLIRTMMTNRNSNACTHIESTNAKAKPDNAGNTIALALALAALLVSGEDICIIVLSSTEQIGEDLCEKTYSFTRAKREGIVKRNTRTLTAGEEDSRGEHRMTVAFLCPNDFVHRGKAPGKPHLAVVLDSETIDTRNLPTFHNVMFDAMHTISLRTIN